MADSGVNEDRVRLPVQARSRRTWDKVLTAGAWILEHEGRENFTIARVCERAGVTPAAIYRRVDSITDLFWAIFERGILPILDEYRQDLVAAAAFPVGSEARVRAVARAVAESFERHIDFLGPVMTYATGDVDLARRGSPESHTLVDAATEALDAGDAEAARDVARMLHAEGSMRTLYGPRWLDPDGESFDAFLDRIERMAIVRLIGSVD